VTAKETVQALYAAYATGNPDRIAALLHPDVIWVAPAGNATQVALGLGGADDAARHSNRRGGLLNGSAQVPGEDPIL
jgi:ketosteroid isomerase-like protein